MLDFLKNVPIFVELSSDELANVAAIVSTVSLQPGEELFTEGSQGDAAYIIQDGVIGTGSRTSETVFFPSWSKPSSCLLWNSSSSIWRWPSKNNSGARSS